MRSQRCLETHHGDSLHLAEHPPKAMDHLPQAIMSLTELSLSAGHSPGTRMTFNPHNHAAGGYSILSDFTSEETGSGRFQQFGQGHMACPCQSKSTHPKV